MNWFILGFFAMLLTSRFFSETLRVLPKATDLLDLVVIPILLLMSLAAPRLRNIDAGLHRLMYRLILAFVVICGLSYMLNLDRVFYPAALLYLFGMIEGPLLFISLNRIIKNKREFGEKISKFIGIMVLVEAAVVIFINIPTFFATQNPDVVSGTFGYNSYQFSAFLIIMGGYFLGKMRISSKSIIYGLAIQLFIIGTFILLQWRTAVPSFFVSYLVLLMMLYGRKIFRLALLGGVVSIAASMMFSYVQESNFNLKYDDLLVVFQNPGDMAEIGKVLAYVNTFEMFSEEPSAILIGSGPGTYVSRANYIFSVEASGDQNKGVGEIVRMLFGSELYMPDVQARYIMPLYELETLFGSMQANNPNSSFLALLAETGLLGLIVMGMIYAGMVVRTLRYLRIALATMDPLLVPLASALVAGAVYLVAIAPLDNYLETARVTLPVWLLFWTVSVLIKMQKVERQQALALAEQEAAYARMSEVH